MISQSSVGLYVSVVAMVWGMLFFAGGLLAGRFLWLKRRRALTSRRSAINEVRQQITNIEQARKAARQ